MESGVVRLKKEIGLLDAILLGVSSAVATAIFFNQLEMTSLAGPASIFAWLLAAALYVAISLTYIELAQTYPEAGGPSRYPIYSHGAATNLINATADLVWYIFIPPIEAYATIEGLSYIFPQLINAKGYPTMLGALVGVAILLAYIPINYYGVKLFAKVTSVYGSIKVAIYILPAVILILMLNRVSNFVNYGGFMPYGVAGIFAAMPYAMFAFGGARIIPDFAEEMKRRRFIIYALIATIVSETAIYILYDYSFITSIIWGRVHVKPGDWASLANVITGNPFITLSSLYHVNSALVLLLIGGIVGPFLTGYVYMGGGARVLMATARSSITHPALKRLHEKYAIPYWALFTMAIVGALVTFLFAPVPSIYGIIVDATVAGYLGFSVNPITMIVLEKQGVIKQRFRGSLAIAAIAFASASLIVFWSGWQAVSYSVAILAVIAAVFAILSGGTVKEGWRESLWYVTYIAFLTLMTYIGSDGALNLIPYIPASIITAAVSVAVFLPWGIWSGLRERNYEVHEREVYY